MATVAGLSRGGIFVRRTYREKETSMNPTFREVACPECGGSNTATGANQEEIAKLIETVQRGRGMIQGARPGGQISFTGKFTTGKFTDLMKKAAPIADKIIEAAAVALAERGVRSALDARAPVLLFCFDCQRSFQVNREYVLEHQVANA
jgi:hypothetical protein